LATFAENSNWENETYGIQRTLTLAQGILGKGFGKSTWVKKNQQQFEKFKAGKGE